MSKHIELTAKNFYDFSATVLLVQMTHMAFSIADMSMVARLGLEKAGGTGLGELVLQVCLAPLYGFFTVYAGQMSRLEGSGETKEHGASLLAALGVMLAATCVFIVAAVISSPALLRAAGQPADIIALTQQFLGVRGWGLPVEFLYGVTAVTLRVLGLRGAIVRTVAIGLACNVALNWVFLFGPLRGWLEPMKAVALATVIAYSIMLAIAFAVFNRKIVRTGRVVWSLTARPKIREYLHLFLKKGPLLGIRNLNDFSVSAVITLLMGTFGPEVLSATAIASSIIFFLYRVPQACCSATYTYYSYHMQKDYARKAIRLLFMWSAIPTGVVGVAVFFLRPVLVSLYGMSAHSSAYPVVASLLNVYLAFLPFYFCEHMFSNVLNARLITFQPWLVSTVVSYSITIPLAFWSAKHVASPQWTLASQGFGTVVIATAYAWLLSRKEASGGILPQQA